MHITHFFLHFLLSNIEFGLPILTPRWDIGYGSQKENFWSNLTGSNQLIHLISALLTITVC